MAMAYRWVLLAALALATPAGADEPMVLGPRQFEHDRSGAGAVLCVWSIYLSVRNYSDVCALPGEPVDAAIDEAIASIDAFIIANSSLRPTASALAGFKQRVAKSDADRAARRGKEAHCRERGEIATQLRAAAPDAIRASVKSLLAEPREPVMNPCL